MATLFAGCEPPTGGDFLPQTVCVLAASAPLVAEGTLVGLAQQGTNELLSVETSRTFKGPAASSFTATLRARAASLGLVPSKHVLLFMSSASVVVTGDQGIFWLDGSGASAVWRNSQVYSGGLGPLALEAELARGLSVGRPEDCLLTGDAGAPDGG